MPKKQKESIKVDPVGPRTAMFKRTLRTARSGYTYVFESDEWRIGSRFKIPWNVLKTRGLNERVSSDLLDSFRELFAELVEEVSDSYARKVFDQIVSLFDFCVDLITVEAVEAWRTRLSICGLSKKTQRDYFTVCRVALNAWSDSNEESAFIRWLHESYADGSLPLQVYAMLLVMVEFGCRPVELAALRAGDVIDGDAEQPYQLAIWSAKGGRKYRSVFRTLELPADLYALLKQVMVETHAQVAEAWDETIPPAISKQLPLFVGRRLLAAGSPEAFVHRIQKVPNAFDITVSDQMRTWFRKCPLTTGRLDGDLMPLSLYRFRRTIGTRLAEAGASDEVIATVLGHSSMVSLRDYTAHTYADQEACDAIMVAAWDPVINIMKDRLLDAPIPGQATICGGGIFTCYACPKFRPFVDAPHHIALARAESERKRRIDQNLSGPEVDSLDLPIAAIKATMRLCEDYHPQEVGDE